MHRRLAVPGGEMTDPGIDELLITPYEQIKFEQLSPQTLEKLAVQEFEPFIATDALAELASRRVDEGRRAALTILDHPWDRHLTAYAMTVLFSYDPTTGIDRMNAIVAQCSDAKILAAMVENVMSDWAQFETADGRALVRALAKRLHDVPPDEFTDIEEREVFLQRVRG